MTQREENKFVVTLVAFHAFLVAGRTTENAVEAALDAAEQFEKRASDEREHAPPGDPL